MTSLPIESITPDLLDAISHRDCILSAPPGAGKSTYLPLRLMNLPCFANKKILLLQPRQVAVRSIARFLALSLNEEVGQTVGYQMRGESAVSANTRLLVITEGLLIAKLQGDPELTDIGLIIFDEFHERSVQSDVALGLSIEVQSALRDDLRLLVMSATLDIAELATLLPKARQLSSSGRAFPIEYFYRPLPNKTARANGNPNTHLINATVNTILEAFNNNAGNILVFLPGASVIKKLKLALERLALNDTIIAPLYGALGGAQQKHAIDVPPNAKRKIVLATNIAETSLTINGVNIVVDSGLEKVQRFIVPRKLNQLLEQMISKASSIQRAGRAGRQRAGVCYRMWSQEQQQFLQENMPAQITQVDISQTLLTLLEWGSDFEQLPIINKPSTTQIEYATNLLQQLGLLNQHQQISSYGRLASKFNTHPRLARLLIEASTQTSNNTKLLSAVVVSVIEGKAIAQLNDTCDIIFQCRYVIKEFSANIQARGLFEYKKDISRIANQLGINNVNAAAFSKLQNEHDISQCIAELLLVAFPDKIGYKRKSGGYAIADGTGAEFLPYHEQVQPQWIICTQTQLTHKTNAIVRQSCELSGAVLEQFLRHNLHTKKHQYWDDSLAKVVCKQVSYIGTIQVQSQVTSFQINDETIALVLQQVRKKGLKELLGKANSLISRMMLLKQVDSEHLQDFPHLSHSSLLDNVDEWLAPFLSDVSTWQALTKLNWVDIVSATMNYSQLHYLAEYFPTHFTAPTGNQHKLDYSEAGKVSLPIRIQELYGLTQQPSVGRNKLAITFSLLSPAHREIQKTADLPNFWTGSYAAVQKDMKGRYPRHFWPDNPQSAQATTKTKKKM